MSLNQAQMTFNTSMKKKEKILFLVNLIELKRHHVDEWVKRIW
jgi:hypothetical protein